MSKPCEGRKHRAAPTVPTVLAAGSPTGLRMAGTVLPRPGAEVRLLAQASLSSDKSHLDLSERV